MSERTFNTMPGRAKTGPFSCAMDRLKKRAALHKKAIIAASAVICALAFFVIAGLYPHHITVINGSETQTYEVTWFATLKEPFALKKPAKENYVFDGWVTAGRVHVVPEQHVIRSQTYTAAWKPKPFTVVYKDGSTVTAATNTAYGKRAVLNNADAFTDSHPYENFAGWKTEDGSVVTTVSGKPGDNIIVTASYTGKKYKITYDLGGGAADNPDTYQYGTGVDKFKNAAKSGYIFDGWYSDSGHTRKVTSIAKNTHGDITLYAAYHAAPAASRQPAVVSSRGNVSALPASSYTWWAAAGGQAAIDEGLLVAYDPNYFAAHAATGYGRAIKTFHAGTVVTINGKMVVIDGELYSRVGVPMDDIYSQLPNGAATPCFQTCVGAVGSVVIKYGHYVS